VRPAVPAAGASELSDGRFRQAGFSREFGYRYIEFAHAVADSVANRSPVIIHVSGERTAAYTLLSAHG
jgi:hypothetical protein